MALNMLEEKSIYDLLQAVTHLVRLPKRQMWLDYDAEADVLYLHFEEKPSSTHSEMRDDGVILDYRDDELVGLTVLEASSR
ncbi:MAG TPA: DUF2283 domain-containing protein [Anaerolineae bacterium]|nr:DUF2283 domain-containing protein [Anaerolineae bacterium]